MNEHKKPRVNKAKNDKDSILADAKNLLYILYPAIQRMPKIERIEGAPVEIKRAVQNIIRHFSIAKECQEVKQEHIREMIGDKEYNQLLTVEKYRKLDRFISTVNSYTGLLKHRTSYKRIMGLKETIAQDWWQWLDWDQRRQCVVSKPQYTFRARLCKKYNLKLKRI